MADMEPQEFSARQPIPPEREVGSSPGATHQRADVSFSDELAVAAERAAALRACGLIPASKFIGRLALLDLDQLGEAIQRWHRTAAEHGDAWFVAEAAVADGVERTRRHTEQSVLLRHMGNLFLSKSWFTAAAPGARIRAAEPAGQYVATLAMLAILVRDGITPAQFDLVYHPFHAIIPLAELVGE